MSRPLPRCADCGYPRERKACVTPEGKSPDFCPMTTSSEVIEQALEAYRDPEVMRLAVEASRQEAEGYADRQAQPYVKKPCKTRIQEIYEFALRMGYRRLGLVSCLGLVRENRTAARILEAHGLEVVSVICKAGAIPKDFLGLTDAEKVHPGEHENMCNPVVQAELCNHSQTDLNVLLGLCVGHDSLFLRYSKAPCTVLAVKDRVTGHNPLAALYTSDSYYVRLKDV